MTSFAFPDTSLRVSVNEARSCPRTFIRAHLRSCLLVSALCMLPDNNSHQQYLHAVTDNHLRAWPQPRCGKLHEHQFSCRPAEPKGDEPWCSLPALDGHLPVRCTQYLELHQTLTHDLLRRNYWSCPKTLASSELVGTVTYRPRHCVLLRSLA
jgi:hypothetical protein